MLSLLDDLDGAGVLFPSATEPFDTATAMGRMLVQMLGMFAQFERDTFGALHPAPARREDHRSHAE